MSLAIAGGYFFLLAAIAWHIATHFSYSMDMLDHMGNAAVRKTVDPVKVHAQVYREVRENIPPALANSCWEPNRVRPRTKPIPGLITRGLA
jgi:hypothetical protein